MAGALPSVFRLKPDGKTDALGVFAKVLRLFAFPFRELRVPLCDFRTCGRDFGIPLR
jgi:hypothetical protein